MSIEDVPQAIEDLALSLRRGEPLQETVNEICREYDISEIALRNRFRRAFDCEIEEYSPPTVVDVDTGHAVAAAAVKFRVSRRDLSLINARFCLDLTSQRRGDEQKVRVWYRYVGWIGYAVVAVEEETNRVVKMDGGPEAWREIFKKVGATWYLK